MRQNDESKTSIIDTTEAKSLKRCTDDGGKPKPQKILMWRKQMKTKQGEFERRKLGSEKQLSTFNDFADMFANFSTVFYSRISGLRI